MKLLLTLTLLTFLTAPRMYAQDAVVGDNREKLFALEVKQIDEFIERFNDDSTSFIRDYFRTHYPNVHMDRAALVRSLIDQRKTTWNKAILDSFFQQALDTASPYYLGYYSPDWFAEAYCACTYRGKPVVAVLLLRVDTDSTGGSKWILADAYCKDIPPDARPLDLPDPGKKFLNPISHTTNFIGLSRAFDDKAHIRDYVDSNFMASPRSRAFLRSVLNGTLSYKYVKEIQYHFLGMSGWIFTVNYFRRDEANSGWLISNLQRADDSQKDAYRTLYFK